MARKSRNQDEAVESQEADAPEVDFVEPEASQEPEVQDAVMRKNKWSGLDHWECDCGFSTFDKRLAESHRCR